MTIEAWIPLNDYSIKYKVSISTLRRRIKTDQVEYLYEDGKYYLRDLPMAKQRKVSPAASEPRVTSAPPQPVIGHPEPTVQTEKSVQLEPKGETAAEILSAATQMLSEIKRAYAQILQEKEEQIIMLKEEISDLRTLVRALESENDRLSSNAKEGAPIDFWLNELK